MADRFTPVVLPPIEQAAHHEYEYFGSTLTTNTVLKIALVILAVIVGALAWALVHASYAADHVKPLIIRINDVGRADAIAYKNFDYKPQAPEIRYFLTQFTIDFYSRNHKTVAQEYVNSLYFLDRKLFNAIDARDRRTDWLPKFLSSSADDVDVTVNNVIIEDLQHEPYRARVEFSKTFTTAGGTPTKHENWAAEFVFRINPDVPNHLIPHNPLGIAITYFRADQAFN